MQVTIVGGGSRQWGPTLIADILRTPALAGVSLVLQDVDPTWLPLMETYTRRLASSLGVPATVRTTTDQRDALAGADFVVVTISTGGFASMRHDLEVPERYGIYQSVGDTVGPGGISRALRNIPVLLGIARDMEALCPDVWLLNITNPMTCLTRAVARETSVRVVGLCHEVGHFTHELRRACGASTVDVDIVGVNHLPLITSLTVDGADGFSRLDALGPHHALKLALYSRLGVLPGAGDRHVAEFFPSFLTEESGWGKGWGIELTDIAVRELFEDAFREALREMAEGTKPLPSRPSGEMVAPVVESLLGGETKRLPLNLPNRGQAPDLPADAVVETMCVVDGSGIVGASPVCAPPVATEWLRRHVAVQELVVEAAVTGSRSLARDAFHLDPLAGRLDHRSVDAMADELLAATAEWLPHLSR